MSWDEVRATCWRCKASYVIPNELYRAAKSSNKIAVHCPYGHAGYYPEGETEADKLRRENDRLTQRLAQKNDTIKYHCERAEKAELSARATRGVVTRMKNRAAAGVCPCCNRTFENLRRHMASKHPEFQATDATEAAAAAERTLQ